MKRKLLQRTHLRFLKQTALAIPAAALMLGQSQGGTSIGINFYGNYYGSYDGGRVVSTNAFGMSAANWLTTPAVADPYASHPTSAITAGPRGALSLNWSSPYTGISKVDPTNTPTLSQGDADVYYGYLDGGVLASDPGYFATLTNLAGVFPSGYVVQAMAATDHGSDFVSSVVSDGVTTQTLGFASVGLTIAGGAYALGQASGVFSGNVLSISGPSSTNSDVASSLAGFLVTDQPVVSSDPVSPGVLNLNAAISLQAGAVGIPPLGYQWRLNGIPIPGATTSFYAKAAAGATDAGNYDLVVTNAYGAGTSTVATVQVIALPQIVRDLASQTNYQSMMEALSVDVQGGTPLMFQWTKNGAPITGATTAALTLANLQASDSANYQVVVTNLFGAATSSVAAVSVLTNLPPYDGFNYTNGDLTGQGIDPAWADSWTTNSSPEYQGDNAVISPGASFSDRDGRQLLVSGGAVQLAASGLYDFENERNLLATLGGPAGGTIYFSFVGQITNNTLWAGVELAQDGTADILLGANNGTVPSYWGWGDRDGGNGANSTISTEATAFLVYRLDFSPTNTQVQLYVNPRLNAEPGTPDVSGSWTNFQFDQVRIVSDGQLGTGEGPNGIIDELRLGGSWASVVPFQGGPTNFPQIVRDVVSQTNYQSMMEVLSVDVKGLEPLMYQWTKNGTPVTGATNSALTLTNLQISDSANYQVVVTNLNGVATSSVAVVSVLSSLPPHEEFNYSAGNLTGLGSDPAWGGPWAKSLAGYNGDNAVLANGASYQDPSGDKLTVSGGAVELAASGSADFENDRNLLATLGGPAGGRVYFSFIGQITNNTFWAGVELAKDATADILLGVNNGAISSYWGWGDRDGGNGISSTVSTETSAFLVYRFDFTPSNTLVQLYVNPTNLAAEPGTPTVSGTWTNFQFDQVRIVSHGQSGTGAGPNGIIDELRLGGSWASVVPFQSGATNVATNGAPGVLTITGSGAGRALVWTNGTLQASATLGVTALWTNVPNATSPYPLPVRPTGRSMFYRLSGSTQTQSTLTIVRSGAGHELVWTGGTLKASASLGATANWTNVPSAVSPYVIPTTGKMMFYRLGGP